MDTWHERTSPLDQVLPTGLGTGKDGIENREKMRDFRERVSTFSLEFSMIRLSVLVRTRGEVVYAARDKHRYQFGGVSTPP